MKPIEFEEQNFRIDPDKDTPEIERCPVPLWTGTDRDNKPNIVTCWSLSDDELETLQATRKLWMVVRHNKLRPTLLTVEMPIMQKDDHSIFDQMAEDEIAFGD